MLGGSLHGCTPFDFVSLIVMFLSDSVREKRHSDTVTLSSPTALVQGDRLEKKGVIRAHTNDQQRCRIVKVRGRESLFSFGQVPLGCLLQGTPDTLS